MNKLASLLIVLTVFFQTTANANTPDFPFLTVTGEAELNIAPDKATLTFSLLAVDEKADKALTTVTNRSVEIVKYLTSKKIKKKEIESYQITKNAIRERGQNYNELQIKGYEVTQNFKITLNDLEQFTAILEKLLSLQNVEHINTQFDVKDRKSFEEKLVIKAGNDAYERASRLAKSVGAKIESVYAINDQQSYSDYVTRFNLNDNYSNVAMRMSEGKVGARGEFFIPQEITVNRQVHVIYKITP